MAAIPEFLVTASSRDDDSELFNDKLQEWKDSYNFNPPRSLAAPLSSSPSTVKGWRRARP